MEKSEESNDNVLPGIGELKSFSQEALGSVVRAIKEAGSLPAAGEDHDFYYSFSDFREFRTAQGERLLSNIGNLLHHWKVHCQWPSDYHGVDPESDELLDSLVEANDILLEGVDTSLDEAAGLKKKGTSQTVAGAAGQQGTPIVSSWNRAKKETPGQKGTNFRFLMAKNIQRPQLKFKDVVDNSNTPFIPIIRSKPNALKPLVTNTQTVEIQPEDLLVPTVIADFVHKERLRGVNNTSINSTSHPYQYELDTFEPAESQLKPRKEQLYASLDDTPFILVEKVEQLEELSERLRGVTEFAVDLEHHSYRSFQGFCCLMQISTRDRDYLVDTLELRNELHILNHSFTNPKILKVFHGADMDICWLQRDFGLYVVNMFDTGQAARVLNIGKYSLAFLLKKYCDVTANKQYQLADWRIRPLPSEMVHYAREDTHYLLYISDRMHNELIRSGNANSNLLLSVYSRSKSVCLKRYEKPLFTSESYLKVLEKHKRAFNTEQMCAFRLLHAWRDDIARQEDESCGFVLPNHMLFQIAQNMPREAHGILACCNPVPTLVKQYMNEMHLLIVQAKEMALTANKNPSSGPVSQVDLGENTRQTNLGSPSTPQQIPQSSIKDADVNHRSLVVNGDSSGVCAPPSLFGQLLVSGPPVIRTKPIVSLFEISGDEQLTDGQRKAEKIKASFENPFQKFLPVKSQSETTEGKAIVDEPQSQEEVNKITEQWKQAVTEAQMEPSSPTGNKRQPSSDSDSEDVTPLRQRTNGKTEAKKRKKMSASSTSHGALDDNDDEDSSAVYETVAHDRPEFVPFDYSSADYSTFSGEAEKDARDKPIVFDPYRSSAGGKSKSPRSKVHMKSGQRSMTFSTNKSTNKQKWPRR